MKKSRCKKLKRKGFTLIEVIIAVTIVVILASLSAPKVVAYIDKAKDAKALTCGKQVYTAAMWSYSEQGNAFNSAKIHDAITSATNINVPATSITILNNVVTIAFTSDNKSYTLTISDSGNSYAVSDGSRQIYTSTT